MSRGASAQIQQWPLRGSGRSGGTPRGPCVAASRLSRPATTSVMSGRASHVASVQRSASAHVRVHGMLCGVKASNIAGRSVARRSMSMPKA